MLGIKRDRLSGKFTFSKTWGWIVVGVTLCVIIIAIASITGSF